MNTCSVESCVIIATPIATPIQLIVFIMVRVLVCVLKCDCSTNNAYATALLL